MASRILRAPVQCVLRNCTNASQCWPFPFGVRGKVVGVPASIQIRGYQNYKTHGEMAALKEPTDASAFSDEPEYPEILDVNKEGELRRKRQAHYDEVKKMPTAHHKMYMINWERDREEMYYIGDLHYNSLEMYQYATRTSHRMEDRIEKPAPEAALEKVDPALVSLIEEILLVNSSRAVSSSSDETENNGTANAIRGILDAIRYHYKLNDTSVLEDPRIEAFWHHPNFKTNYDKDRFEDKETFAPWLQFTQYPQLLLSSEIPLQPIIPATSDEILGSNFPNYDYYPEELGMVLKKNRLVSTAGYWCNTFQYPILTTSSLKKVLPSSLNPSVSTDHLNSAERRRRLAAHGLMMNFATAVGTAFSCGFTIFHEVTYPFVAQHIVTDGQTWHFSKYQLNTMAFGPDYTTDKQNIAWSSEEMKLYDSIEDGKIQGLDVTVLSRIVETVKAPREYVANPRPYTEADTEKEFLKRGEEMFKSFASRKFILRDCLQYEVPLWVKIFKMREDAVPTPTIKWERPASGKQHIYQFDKKMYEAEVKETKEKYKKISREKFFGLRPMRSPLR